jgi:hypothetical protein
VNPIDRVPDVPGYTELQREMRDAIRAQHPEWVEADGKSARYDYYESLFAALLVSHRVHARASQSRSCRDRDDG